MGIASSSDRKAKTLVKGGVFAEKSDIITEIQRFEHGSVKRSRQYKSSKDFLHVICQQQNDEKIQVAAVNKKAKATGEQRNVAAILCQGEVRARFRGPVERCGDMDADEIVCCVGDQPTLEQSKIDQICDGNHWEITRILDHTCSGKGRSGKGIKSGSFSTMASVRMHE